ESRQQIAPCCCFDVPSLHPNKRKSGACRGPRLRDSGLFRTLTQHSRPGLRLFRPPGSRRLRPPRRQKRATGVGHPPISGMSNLEPKGWVTRHPFLLIVPRTSTVTHEPEEIACFLG